jgi:DNA polymerase III epsilon subunit-like protein
MKILLLDTETNGLPKNKFASVTESAAWPAILQLSWAIYEVAGTDLRPLEARDIGLALDPAIAWDTGAAAIHGISESEARYGTPPADAFRELAAALRNDIDVVVAHNLEFDKPVICAAAHRAGVPDVWPAGVGEFCTMRATRDLIRIPSPSWSRTDGGPRAKSAFKAPKLNELYAWLYGHVYDISGATLHTAASDTHCLGQCVAGLLAKGYLVVDGARLRIPVPVASVTA